MTLTKDRKAELVEKFGRSAGDTGSTEVQVALRWLTQRGVVAIPKSSRRERLIENLASLDFDLSLEEIQSLSELDRGLRLVEPGWAPDWD